MVNFLFCFHAILLNNFAFHSHTLNFLCATNKSINFFWGGGGKENKYFNSYISKLLNSEGLRSLKMWEHLLDMIWSLVQLFLNFIPITEEKSTCGLLEEQGFQGFPHHKKRVSRKGSRTCRTSELCVLVFYDLGCSFFRGREDKNHAYGTKQRNVCKEVLREILQPNILLRIY